MAAEDSEQAVPTSERNPSSTTVGGDTSTPSTSTPNHPSQSATREPAASAQPGRSNSTSTSTSHLNPRSCVTCRRRKVRCNKENPCANCVRAGIECIFPGPGRAPRKSRKPPDAELLARLKKLEGVVTSLGAQVDDNGVLHAALNVGERGQAASGSPDGQTTEAKRQSIDKNLGRLVINEDRSRYVSNQFWASMGDEIAEMRDLLDAATSEDDFEESESPQDKFSSHQGFIFGYSSLKVDLKALHPSPSQIFILWEVFKENVDPVVKILHRPTAKNILMNAATSVDRVSKPAEALLFAIYFGAVVSLTEGQCRQLLDEDKTELIKKYRFATEQALARADFLNSSSLMCLQAFVFFLVFVRHMDDSRLVWALGGLAIHLAQALGIHRDGSHFNLTPFDIEMRRRLWWHISILDNRSAEDHGTDPTFTEQFYDTKFPLNVNDDDIYPEMKEPPNERPGATEMTFCLIRFELSIFSRRLNLTLPGVENRCREQTFEEKEKMIDACHRRIEEKYLQYCHMSIPIFWVSATVARLILAKMWLMVHHPRSFMMDHLGQPLPSETKDRLFVTSIEVIEFSYLLEQNENTAKWGWLFRTYMQWQSVAFVLSEICVRPPGPDVDRAWRAIDSVYTDHFISVNKNHKGMLWKPMRGLMTKAKSVRSKQLRETRAQQLQMQNKGQPANGSLASGQQQQQFDLDPWTAHLSERSNMIGAAAEALDLDLDVVGLMSPQGSERSGGSGNLATQSQHPPRAMSTVFGPSSGAGGEQMQGIIMPQNLSPTLSQSGEFGLGGSPGVGMGSGSGSGSGSDAMPPNFNPDFLNWSGWNPGVGDFNVAPQVPDPMVGFFDGAPMQQEWY